MFVGQQSHEYIQLVTVRAVIFSSSIYGSSEQNCLASYTGYRGRWGTAEMWDGVKDPTGDSQEEKEETEGKKLPG